MSDDNLHCGRLVRGVPRKLDAGERTDPTLTVGNSTSMRRADPFGRACNWISRILIDENRQFGGFYEELLTIPTGSASSSYERGNT